MKTLKNTQHILFLFTHFRLSHIILLNLPLKPCFLLNKHFGIFPEIVSIQFLVYLRLHPLRLLRPQHTLRQPSVRLRNFRQKVANFLCWKFCYICSIRQNSLDSRGFKRWPPMSSLLKYHDVFLGVLFISVSFKIALLAGFPCLWGRGRCLWWRGCVSWCPSDRPGTRTHPHPQPQPIKV